MSQVTTQTPPPKGEQTGSMISLQQLTKDFGTGKAAVDHLDLEIPRGEIVILVGSSGCGKTTTMKMINRIIEPTSGRLILDGEDVTNVDPDQLRRRIGYVIQQIGLFPHMTIAENIATVPKLLGWKKARMNERIDELLDMVGMEAGSYRGRYPKELSGGQRQRVGVARALAADPDVMLMDEPFGAIDPITRERLQNEFLRVQAEVRKTIVFVTHDIDEAIKMGDRIAILKQGAEVAQYGTPEEILTNPADDFVADFIGSGASLKRLNLSRVRDVPHRPWPAVMIGSNPSEAMGTIRQSGTPAALLLDEQQRPLSWLSPADIDRAGDRITGRTGVPATAVIGPHSALSEALNLMVTAPYSLAIVTDAAGTYQGVLDINAINASIREAPAPSAAQRSTAAWVGTQTPADDDGRR